MDAPMAKPSEVINLHIGQAGCDFGASCWELYCFEQNVEPDGTCKGNVPHSFFYDTGGSKAVPRAAFIDLESSAIDNIRVGQFRHLFNTGNMLNGKEDAASCFGRGFLTLGKNLIDPVMNRVRVMTEACGRLQGFLIFRAYGGGTGSGFTARLLEELSHEYPKADKFDFSIFMSPKLSSLPVEPYNAAFALHHSLEYSCASFVFDNEALYDICDRLLDVCNVRFLNINRLLAQVISCITGPFRFDGFNSVTMNELRTNLIPLPRLQYAVVSYAPLISKQLAVSEVITEGSLVNACFAPSNQLIKCDLSKGMYMSCTLLFRGDVNNSCVNSALQTLKAKKSIRFVEWCPTKLSVRMNNTPPFSIPDGDMAQVERSCVALSNSTHIKAVFRNIGRKFDVLFSKRAFIHWYLDEGLEEGDFHDTRLDLKTLESDYSEIETAL